MHKNPHLGSLFEFDVEIESTFHNLKRHQYIQEESEADTSTSMMVDGENVQRRTPRDYVTLGAHVQTPGITRLPMTTNNFKLKSALISMVQQSQFGDIPMEEPNLHLLVFLKVWHLRDQQSLADTIWFCLFPFSLKDKARVWLYSLPLGLITTWDELIKIFVTKFVAPSKTVSLRNQITSFAQKEDKSLYEAWEHFKDILRLCPLHGF